MTSIWIVGLVGVIFFVLIIISVSFCSGVPTVMDSG